MKQGLLFGLVAGLTSLSILVGAQAPQFEAASIKPNAEGGAVNLEFPAGRFRATNAPLRFVVRWAYRIPEPRIIGGPEWIGADRFDIAATAPAEGWSRDRAAELVRGLLADRFKLAAHMETRELPFYALVVAKPGTLGPNLRPAAFDCSAPNQRASMVGNRVQCGLLVGQSSASASLRGGGQTLADFTRTLGEYVDRPLVDRTGLEGRYDLELQFTADRGAIAGLPAPGGLTAADSDIAPLPTALQTQLGLKLEAQRGPVEVLVIDRVEKPTAD